MVRKGRRRRGWQSPNAGSFRRGFLVESRVVHWVVLEGPGVGRVDGHGVSRHPWPLSVTGAPHWRPGAAEGKLLVESVCQGDEVAQMRDSPGKEIPEADSGTKPRDVEPELSFDPDDLVPASGGEISSETVERIRHHMKEKREAEGEQS